MYIDSVLKPCAADPMPMPTSFPCSGSSRGGRLEYLRVPVWIWHGSADASVPLAVAESLAARIPGARLEVFDGGGHMAVHTHTAAILSALVGSEGQGSGKG